MDWQLVELSPTETKRASSSHPLIRSLWQEASMSQALSSSSLGRLGKLLGSSWSSKMSTNGWSRFSKAGGFGKCKKFMGTTLRRLRCSRNLFDSKKFPPLHRLFCQGESSQRHPTMQRRSCTSASRALDSAYSGLRALRAFGGQSLDSQFELLSLQGSTHAGERENEEEAREERGREARVDLLFLEKQTYLKKMESWQLLTTWFLPTWLAKCYDVLLLISQAVMSNIMEVAGSNDLVSISGKKNIARGSAHHVL